MPEWAGLGKVLILWGLVLVVGGLLLVGLGKLPGEGAGWGWLGRLPGDVLIKKDNVTFYFPLATSLLISLLLTVLFYFFSKGSS
ncbi:MAG: DUF2905 domain-containing protein [Nitrospirae bacterium]|nr:DUF2905 domain-containing protein [Nitrospirota bacterium]